MKSIAKQRHHNIRILVFISVCFFSILFACFEYYILSFKNVGEIHQSAPLHSGGIVATTKPGKAAIQVPLVYKPDFSIPVVKDGMAPVLTSVATKQKVVFLGIDDGAFKDSSVVDMMKKII